MARMLDLVGNTPLVELVNIPTNPAVRVLAKVEGRNPASSVKDRAAKSMIEGAEARGVLGPGTRIIEPTSGNTGIALAMIASLKGYSIELVMPENSTAERVATMEAFGAKVTLTPADLGMEGAIDHARDQVAKGGVVMLDQFSNPDNWGAHYRTTGPEIWRDTEGSVTHFVSSMGTTGTIMGVSRSLKELRSSIQIVGVQPAEGAKIPGIRRWPREYLPAIFEPSRVDLTLDVTQEESEEMARRLAREEGLFCGVSSGGACAAACRLASRLESGTVVFIVCDQGDRYLSSDLFSHTTQGAR
ncbi:MAG: cysteine synthase CysM [Fibrobacterota bacterium]|nr:cysteine synthase CysM [Fibrobacterota bacterium]QQS03840.1 MAG: cysteine synthase CysM [Fibrobacterota bacterium]